MTSIGITRADLEELKRIGKESKRWDWPAVFSCNQQGDIWPTPGYGFTKDNDRSLVRGEHWLIDAIANEMLNVRDSGGRFFIDDGGAFRGDTREQFVKFFLRKEER